MATATNSRNDTPPWLDDHPIIKRYWYQPANLQNNHAFICFVGAEGFAKSWSALRTGQLADPSLTPDNVLDRVHWRAEDMLESITKDSNPGEFYMLDESGVSMGNRTWHEDQQIKLNKAFQTIRDDNLILVLTLPRLEELDVQLEGRVRLLVEMHKKDEDRMLAYGAPKEMNPTRDGYNEIYKKYPRVNGQRMEQISFKPPDEELIEEYERGKQEFKDEYYEAIVGDDDEAEEEEMGAGELVEEIVENDYVERLTSTHGNTGEPYIDKGKIYEFYDDVSYDQSRTIKAMLEDREVI